MFVFNLPDPFRAAIFSIAALAACASNASQASRIQGILRPFVDRNDLSGVVAIAASNDRILSSNAVGYADIAAHKPMATDTLFWIASMSKPIAATAVMLLVDEGKVRLDDPVEKYLPKFKPPIMVVSENEKSVQLRAPEPVPTVRQLLGHRSGLRYSSSIEEPALDRFPLALRVESYGMESLRFQPGTDWSYSDAGINTAARIVEVVSGMRYDEFLQQRLFNPLEMRDTTFWPTESQLKRLAKSYRSNSSMTGLEETPIVLLSYPLNDHEHRYPVAGAGLFSTGADILKFCQMVMNGGTYAGRRYLTETSVKAMTQYHSTKKPPGLAGMIGTDGYGLGWATRLSGEYGHDGAYATNMTIDPARGIITVWMTQYYSVSGGDGYRKARGAFEKAVREEFP
jgi:CubicO group peptidase (beta-lactamase class C family)